ncbi:hypothetical protein [Dokdonia sp. Asnod1-B02]|uniref:hypothetical protein n=1 Tax=Dokdonia sp. Asnod1-B02 TaxID=3160573 RepID=UPI00386447F4
MEKDSQSLKIEKDMKDLKKLISDYSLNWLNSDELIHLQTVHKLVSWHTKTDIEKQATRKAKLQMLQIHFKDDSSIKYLDLVIQISDQILYLIENTKQFEIKDSYTDNNQFYWARVHNMLWCEKEYLFYQESIQSTRLHVPIKIFDSLFSHLEKLPEFKKLRFDIFMTNYQEMIQLFNDSNAR